MDITEVKNLLTGMYFYGSREELESLIISDKAEVEIIQVSEHMFTKEEVFALSEKSD